MIGCVTWAVESTKSCALCCVDLGAGDGVLTAAGGMFVDFGFGTEG